MQQRKPTKWVKLELAGQCWLAHRIDSAVTDTQLETASKILEHKQRTTPVRQTLSTVHHIVRKCPQYMYGFTFSQFLHMHNPNTTSQLTMSFLNMADSLIHTTLSITRPKEHAVCTGFLMRACAQSLAASSSKRFTKSPLQHSKQACMFPPVQWLCSYDGSSSRQLHPRRCRLTWHCAVLAYTATWLAWLHQIIEVLIKVQLLVQLHVWLWQSTAFSTMCCKQGPQQKAQVTDNHIIMCRSNAYP